MKPKRYKVTHIPTASVHILEDDDCGSAEEILKMNVDLGYSIEVYNGIFYFHRTSGYKVTSMLEFIIEEAETQYV